MFNIKKKEAKLKEDLKKEILKELQKEKEKEQEKNKIVQPVELPPVEHTPEDIYEIRKSFLKIFLFAVAALFIIIIIIINPFDFGKQKEKEEVVVEEEVIEETLITRKDGVIENSNEELLELFNMVTPNIQEYYLYDSTYLYSKDELLIEEISKDYLLYLLSKTPKFQKMINDDFGQTKAELCVENGYIKIPVEKINELITSNFIASDITEYPEFIYTHYINNEYSANIRFVYSDGYYVSFCKEPNNELKYSSVARPLIKNAIKENGYIKITTKVAFSTSEKVYADYELTKVISDNSNTDILEYINNANEYQYIFKLEDNRYKFEKVVKLN